MFRRQEPQLSIGGRQEPPTLSPQAWSRLQVISIHDGEGPPAWTLSAAQTVSLSIPDTTPGRSRTFWKPEEARLAWNLTKSMGRSSQLHVHCHAGLSRSTALAAGTLRRSGHAPGRCWDLVFAARPQAQPNLWITQLADPSGALLRSLLERSPERWAELQVMEEALKWQ